MKKNLTSYYRKTEFSFLWWKDKKWGRKLPEYNILSIEFTYCPMHKCNISTVK